MRYLLTGGAGFIGSHIVDSLIERGEEVVVLDDFSTGKQKNLGKNFNSQQMRMVHGSVLDKGVLEEVTHRVDRIFHLAAAVGVFNIVKDPLSSMRTNILGTDNVLGVALQREIPILLTSSSEIYGKNESNSLHEDDDRIVGAPQKFRWSYSDAKAIDEAMAFSLYAQRNLETRVVRLFNTVGPRQVGNYGMVIPRFVSSALKNEPLEIYGTGNQTRCFCHVEDSVRAILLIEQSDATIGLPINVGNDREISVKQLAKKVIKLTGSNSAILNKNYDDVYGAGFEDMAKRVPNLSRLRSLTGWAPRKTIDDIILDVAQFLNQEETF